VIKCFQYDYRTEYEFKDASLGLGLPTEVNPKIIKQEYALESFRKFREHMIKIMFKEMVTPFTSEVF